MRYLLGSLRHQGHRTKSTSRYYSSIKVSQNPRVLTVTLQPLTGVLILRGWERSLRYRDADQGSRGHSEAVLLFSTVGCLGLEA